MRRRGLAARLAGALLLIPWRPFAGASAQPPDAARVKVAVIEGTQLFPMYVIRTKGLAEKYQLQIEQIKAAGPQGHLDPCILSVETGTIMGAAGGA